jgi:hypothetical protein
MIDLKSHETNKLSGCWEVPKAAQTKKWACAHWCAPAKSGTTQQFPRTNIRRSEPKDKRVEPVLSSHLSVAQKRFKKPDANEESRRTGRHPAHFLHHKRAPRLQQSQQALIMITSIA